MSIEHKRRGRGRPRDPAKLEAIVGAAYDLFLDRGIAATTMELVAERAGVSKMTVYANFQDKPALLAAVFDRRIKTVRLPDLSVGSNLNLSLERLTEFGELLVSLLTRPEVIRETRVIAAECAADQPRLAAVFYTAGRGEMLKRVAVFLKGLTERGVLAIDDPGLAAGLRQWRRTVDLNAGRNLVSSKRVFPLAEGSGISSSNPVCSTRFYLKSTSNRKG
jgi:TetR/AcrR family transcriptional regulator, mexJK operon transcriptional repressor